MKIIPASELIITPRGSIYHIDCRPEEVATTIILVGDPDRVEEISKHFDKIEYKNKHREFITHTGYIGNKRLSVCSTGIGPDNIDIVMNEMDALFNIDFSSRTIKEKISTLRAETLTWMPLHHSVCQTKILAQFGSLFSS